MKNKETLAHLQRVIDILHEDIRRLNFLNGFLSFPLTDEEIKRFDKVILSFKRSFKRYIARAEKMEVDYEK